MVGEKLVYFMFGVGEEFCEEVYDGVFGQILGIYYYVVVFAGLFGVVFFFGFFFFYLDGVDVFDLVYNNIVNNSFYFYYILNRIVILY